MRPTSKTLFNERDWFSVDQLQKEKMAKEIAGYDSNQLLNTSTEDLVRYLEAKYRIEVPVLRRDEIEVDQNETQIDVSRRIDMFIHDRSRPFMVAGTAVEVTVPFDGDPSAFGIRPSRFGTNPPQANVLDGALVIRIVGTNLTPEAVKAEIDQTLARIQEYVGVLRADASALNNDLAQIARNSIEARKAKLLANQSLVQSLGYKIRERSSGAPTFPAPEVRRKIAPVMPKASSTPFKPEPVLEDADYEHILGVIQGMAHVMERSPSAFVGMDEESLRSHFLVQLNGHFQGQATGETFNFQGKTDILIRSDGKNIFIAECKFWGGPKVFSEAIDQLLSYSSWRDTKVAVILFNRNKEFSKVLEQIPQITLEHPNCKRRVPWDSETSFRFVFRHREDQNREMVLSVMAFNVPT